MTEAGARENTKSQMVKTLRFSLPQDRLQAAFSELRNRLNAVQDDDKVKLAIANSIWPSDRYKFLDSYIGLLKGDYDVSVTPLDYSKPEAARSKINKWAEDKTQDKIQNLISPRILTPDTKLTLVDAIYFYGKWQSVFQPEETMNCDFDVTPDKKDNVPVMRQTGEFAYADLDSVQVLEMPYKGAKLSMLLILPKSETGLKAVEASLSQPTLAGWTSKLAKTEVDIAIPKFKITWGVEELKQPLQALGMNDAFDAGAANFAGMDGNSNMLYIGHVLHKAFIDVKEEGTEAAAATAVVMEPNGAAPVHPLFLATHPFIFLIQDNETGSILFMGRVVDPK